MGIHHVSPVLSWIGLLGRITDRQDRLTASNERQGPSLTRVRPLVSHLRPDVQVPRWIIHPGCLDLPGRKSLGELAQVNLEHPIPEREWIFGLEDVFSEGVSKDPESLADGMTALLPVSFGPQQLGQVVT